MTMILGCWWSRQRCCWQFYMYMRKLGFDVSLNWTFTLCLSFLLLFFRCSKLLVTDGWWRNEVKCVIFVLQFHAIHFFFAIVTTRVNFDWVTIMNNSWNHNFFYKTSPDVYFAFSSSQLSRCRISFPPFFYIFHHSDDAGAEQKARKSLFLFEHHHPLDFDITWHDGFHSQWVRLLTLLW